MNLLYKSCRCPSEIGIFRSLSSQKKVAAILRSSSLLTRLQILLLLRQSPHCVSDLVTHTKKSQTSISHHLASLRKSFLVTKKQDGKFVKYSLMDNGKKLIEAVENLKV